MSISSELMQRISLLLRPLMENKDQRRGYLIRALGTDSTVLYSLRLDMSTNDFIPNLVNELVKFGEIDYGGLDTCF
jgi:Effector-associated domain 8